MSTHQVSEPIHLSPSGVSEVYRVNKVGQHPTPDTVINEVGFNDATGTVGSRHPS